MGVLSARHVHTTAVVDAASALSGAQAAGRHRASGSVDLVQLLSAPVGSSGSTQLAPGTFAETSDDAPASLTGVVATSQQGSLGGTTLTTSSSGSGPSSGSTLLLLTTAGAALALAGTGWEGSRRQRVRTSAARGHGRRAAR